MAEALISFKSAPSGRVLFEETNKQKILDLASKMDGVSGPGAYQTSLKTLWDAEKDKKVWESRARKPGDISK